MRSSDQVSDLVKNCFDGRPLFQSGLHPTVSGKFTCDERTIRKAMAGVGNFRAAGIFFRYQIPCMNFF